LLLLLLMLWFLISDVVLRDGTEEVFVLLRLDSTRGRNFE